MPRPSRFLLTLAVALGPVDGSGVASAVCHRAVMPAARNATAGRAGKRLNCWKTKPIDFLRMAGRS